MANRLHAINYYIILLSIIILYYYFYLNVRIRFSNDKIHKLDKMPL